MPTDIIEMFWGCLTCKGENLGRHKVCQSCGKPRTEESPEWMPDDVSPMAAVTDSNLLEKFEGGVDWICKFCSSSQFRSDGNCAQCGADQTLTVEKPNSIEAFRVPPRHATPSPPTRADSVSEPPVSISTPFSPPRRNPAYTLALVAGTLIVALVFYLLFRTKVVDAQVTAMSWERSVFIERHSSYSYEGWSPVDGAYNVREVDQRIHHYDSVQTGSHRESYIENYNCGETCVTVRGACTTTRRDCKSNKNGSATCTGGDRVCQPDSRSCTPKVCSRTAYKTVPEYTRVPRYQGWYAWSTWEWRYNRTIPASGAGLEPRWPSEAQIGLNRSLGPGESERESTRKETYKVVFQEHQDTFSYEPKSEGEYRQFQVGQRRKLRVNVVDGVKVLQ